MYRRLIGLFLALGVVFLPRMALAQTVNPLGDLISSMYTFAQGIIGLGIFLMFVYAGLCYMMNNGKDFITGRPAWKIIQDAVVGAVLLFSAYLILNTINHDLVSQPAETGLPQRQ